jgi:hypothetical protein
MATLCLGRATQSGEKKHVISGNYNDAYVFVSYGNLPDYIRFF